MNLSNILITLGLAALAVGLVVKYAPWLLNWFGKLPGDIRIQSEHSFVFVPFTSMIIISIAVSVLLNLLGKK